MITVNVNGLGGDSKSSNLRGWEYVCCVLAVLELYRYSRKI
jgi:hypothetical protein